MKRSYILLLVLFALVLVLSYFRSYSGVINFNFRLFPMVNGKVTPVVRPGRSFYLHVVSQPGFFVAGKIDSFKKVVLWDNNVIYEEQVPYARTKYVVTGNTVYFGYPRIISYKSGVFYIYDIETGNYREFNTGSDHDAYGSNGKYLYTLDGNHLMVYDLQGDVIRDVILPSDILSCGTYISPPSSMYAVDANYFVSLFHPCNNGKIDRSTMKVCRYSLASGDYRCNTYSFASYGYQVEFYSMYMLDKSIYFFTVKIYSGYVTISFLSFSGQGMYLSGYPHSGYRVLYPVSGDTVFVLYDGTTFGLVSYPWSISALFTLSSPYYVPTNPIGSTSFVFTYTYKRLNYDVSASLYNILYGYSYGLIPVDSDKMPMYYMNVRATSGDGKIFVYYMGRVYEFDDLNRYVYDVPSLKIDKPGAGQLCFGYDFMQYHYSIFGGDYRENNVFSCLPFAVGYFYTKEPEARRPTMYVPVQVSKTSSTGGLSVAFGSGTVVGVVAIILILAWLLFV